MQLADLVRAAAAKGRHVALAYPQPGKRDELAWEVIEAFDANVRGHVERDRQIEDERDRVLIAAVKLADIRLENEAVDIEVARRQLIDTIDYLEQAVLRFGIVNRVASKRGYGTPGTRVSIER